MTIHELLDRLNEAKLHYTLSSHRDGAVMANVAVPGQRWEIEVFADGHAEIEVFSSDGSMGDELTIASLIAKFAE